MKTQGIYILTGRNTGLSYVGQSIDLQRRIKQHLTGKSYKLIGKTIQQHSADVFKVQTIEYPGATRTALDAIEKWYISKLNTLVPNGYNLTLGGDTNPMDEPHIREHHKRVSGAKTREMNHRPDNKERSRKRLTERNKQRWQDPEYRAKISKRTSEYNKKRWQDPEYKKRMSERIKGANNPKHLAKKKHNPDQLLLPL